MIFKKFIIFLVVCCPVVVFDFSAMDIVRDDPVPVLGDYWSGSMAFVHTSSTPSRRGV